MTNNPKPIPPVPFDVLMMAHGGGIDDKDESGPDDASISPLLQTLQDEDEARIIRAIYYRLRALAKLLREGEGKPWTYAVANVKGLVVNEAVFKAAARASLFEADAVGQVAFDREEFMKIALEDSKAKGRA